MTTNSALLGGGAVGGTPVGVEFVTVEMVRSALGIATFDTVDDDWLALCVKGVNQFVTRTHRTMDAATFMSDDAMVWGATQLAVRWYGRRGSNDIAAYAEMGGPPPSIDQDIAVSLRIGRYFPPVVA